MATETELNKAATDLYNWLRNEHYTPLESIQIIRKTNQLIGQATGAYIKDEVQKW